MGGDPRISTPENKEEIREVKLVAVSETTMGQPYLEPNAFLNCSNNAVGMLVSRSFMTAPRAVLYWSAGTRGGK